jgi:hypothetical protein
MTASYQMELIYEKKQKLDCRFKLLKKGAPSYSERRTRFENELFEILIRGRVPVQNSYFNLDFNLLELVQYYRTILEVK